MNNVFTELYNELHSLSFLEKNPLKSFLIATKFHAILIFFIASQKDYKSTLEDICYNISSKVISRSTIQNILKEGVSVGFFIKEKNTKDKRSKFYRVSDEAKKIIFDWAYNRKKVFSSLQEISIKNSK